MRWVAGWAAARASSLSPCGDGCKTLGELSAKPGQRPLNFSGLTAQMLCRSLNGGRSDSDKSQVCLVADECERLDFRILVEPARQCRHLCESAKPTGRDMLHVGFFALKQNKVVPLGRWHGLREFQKIQRYRQVQL